MNGYDELVRHPGNRSLFFAVELSALAARAGVALHVHAEGVRGTGKTSVFRAARPWLPPIVRIRGCLYNCDPAAPHCPAHRGLAPSQAEALGVEEVPMPFLEISHAAKIGTVVGSIDLARLTDAARAEAALLPGTLAQAHRGIVFVDEINRLAETSPELADVLLDAMGTRPGRLQIEEAGLPVVQLPVQVTVWAASNPDEDPGPLDEIRRQLSDRFDLAVAVARPSDEELVTAILELSDRRLGRDARADEAGAFARGTPGPRRFDPEGFRRAEVGGELRRAIAGVYARFSLESLRAAEAAQLAARAAAALEGRTSATIDDLLAVAPLVLRHRVEGDAFARAVQFLGEQGSERIAGVRALSDTGPEPPPRPRPSDAVGLDRLARAAVAADARPEPARRWWSRLWEAASGATPPAHAPADARHPVVAPPDPARPLLTLPPNDWVHESEDVPR